MVHTESEKSTIDISKLVWRTNIDFRLIPPEAVEQFPDRPYSLKEWKENAVWLNRNPNYWNVALISEDGLVWGVVMGFVDWIEKVMFVTRAAIDPDLRSFSGGIDTAIPFIKELARESNLIRVFWLTDKAEAFERRLGGQVGITNLKVMEVL